VVTRDISLMASPMAFHLAGRSTNSATDNSTTEERNGSLLERETGRTRALTRPINWRQLPTSLGCGSGHPNDRGRRRGKGRPSTHAGPNSHSNLARKKQSAGNQWLENHHALHVPAQPASYLKSTSA